jgi:hypothetical protein
MSISRVVACIALGSMLIVISFTLGMALLVGIVLLIYAHEGIL